MELIRRVDTSNIKDPLFSFVPISAFTLWEYHDREGLAGRLVGLYHKKG